MFEKSPNLKSIGNILIAVVLILLAAVAGYSAGVYFDKNKQTSAGSDSVVREIFGDSLFMNNLSGKILAINGGNLTVKVDKIISANLPAQYQIKRVAISQDTKLVLRTNKSFEELNKEMRQASAGGKSFAPPAPYSDTTITASELKTGDSIHFTFASDKNLGILASQFMAEEIDVSR